MAANASITEDAEEIRGCLLVLLILLIAGVLHSIWSFGAGLHVICSHRRFLRDAHAPGYHSLLAPLVFGELLWNALSILICLLLIRMMWRRSRRFPRMFTWFALINLLIAALDFWMAGQISELAANEDPSAILGACTGLLFFLLFVPYLLRSKRARTMFTR